MVDSSIQSTDRIKSNDVDEITRKLEIFDERLNHQDHIIREMNQSVGNISNNLVSFYLIIRY